MTVAVGRVADYLRVPVAERAGPTTLGVLAGPREGRVVAAALARAYRSRCAVIASWRAAPCHPALATPAARRLAERLARRGLEATARGRVVSVALPDEPDDARTATERVLTTIDDTPLVLVVAGPRPPELDRLLAQLDRLVVVPPRDALPGLDTLALEAAAHVGRSVARLDLPDLPLHDLAVLSPRLRAAARAALEGGDRA